MTIHYQVRDWTDTQTGRMDMTDSIRMTDIYGYDMTDSYDVTDSYDLTDSYDNDGVLPMPALVTAEKLRIEELKRS